jgi:multidrug efflux pump subunit AcrB
MAEASRRIQDRLWEFDGVGNVADDLIPGKRELRVTLRPSARVLGLTLDDVAKQLRLGFFGGEAVRLRRGRDEVIVRVRYPDDERRSVMDLENLRVTTARGHKIPFLEAADVEWARGYANIMHQGAKRRVRILADVDDRVANAERIVQTLQAGFLDEVVGQYNDIRWEFGGDRERMDESMSSLWSGLKLALIAIYAILASMLRSYVQPIVILAAVPFGVIGAVVGHALLGLDLTLLSLFGVVALSGVVVNDSLVLVDVINSGIRDGRGVREAVLAAGEKRFRAVVLTSVTTVAGLAPLILERSSQAQTIIPMAVSLSFGLMFATALTLFVVPALYLIVNDGRRVVYSLIHGGALPPAELVEEAACDERPTTV